METVTFNPPKAKRRVNIPQQPPFPTPIGTLIGHTPNSNDWPTFRGHLHGNSVCIENRSHADALAHMGFFGNNLARRLSPCKGQGGTESHYAEDSQKESCLEDLETSSWSGLSITESWSTTEPEPEAIAPVKNMLYMTTVEAFFLSFGLGCLLITDNKMKVMNLEDMWECFCHQDVIFPYHYIAYHHFRSKGWVVKSGIKYGTTYVLYKVGPPFYHASYSVIVKPVEGESLTPLPNIPETPLTWSALAGVNRITEHVAKELMYCYVIKPTDLSTVDLKSPLCISKFKVQEILIRRWVSSEERAQMEEKI